MLMTPARDGKLYYNDVIVRGYHAFVDSHLQIVEEIITEDCKRHIVISEWERLNDIEKFIASDRGLDIPEIRAERNAKGPQDLHEAEIIPFPLCL